MAQMLVIQSFQGICARVTDPFIPFLRAATILASSAPKLSLSALASLRAALSHRCGRER